MSKLRDALKSIMDARIPKLAFLASVKLPKRPKKAECIHPRNEAGKLIAASSGVVRVMRGLISGYSDKELNAKNPKSGFSPTAFAASVGAILGVQAHEKDAFYALVLLLGIDEHPDSQVDTIRNNATKWTRKDAFQRASYRADLALYSTLDDPLKSYIVECWKRVQDACTAEAERVRKDTLKSVNNAQES